MLNGIITWLHSRLNSGIYRGPLARFVDKCEQLTLNRRIKRRVQTALNLPATRTPEWVSELYQLASLGLAFVLLIVAHFSLPQVAYGAALVALYRPLEIFVFILSWVFVHDGPVHSYKRSLAGFILNLAEVVVFYAAVYIGLGCMSGHPSMLTALYSSARISVTIGPISSGEPQTALGALLIVTQIVVSYAVIVISIANVVGALRRREPKHNDEGA